MNREEFNAKYKDYLEDGFYGLALNNPKAIEYLDKRFQEFTKRPDFKFSQIKGKFSYFSFYADGVSLDERFEVETKLKEIYTGTV
jgi:hypothetical protein